MIEQFVGGVTPDHVRLVDVVVVLDAARPVGIDGIAAQLADDVVTVTDELWLPVPWLSVAATVNVYVVDADSPVAEKLVDVEVPIDVPLLYTV